MTTPVGNGDYEMGRRHGASGGAVTRLTQGEGKMVPIPRGARTLIIKGGQGIGNIDWRDGGGSLGGLVSQQEVGEKISGSGT